VRKLPFIPFCLLFCFTTCTDETEKIYRWENLEKELHEVAKEAVKEITTMKRTIALETRNSRVRCLVSLDDGFWENNTYNIKTYCMSFELQEARQKRAVERSLTQSHGMPNPEWKRAKEYRLEQLSWNECQSWYYSITVIESHVMNFGYGCTVTLNFKKNSL